MREIIYGEIGFRDEADEIDFAKKYFAGGEVIKAEKYHCDTCAKNFGGRARSDLKPGTRVAIVLKKDQPTGKLTEGIVKNILTGDSFHPRGVKVRLQDGQVGRVQKILN